MADSASMSSAAHVYQRVVPQPVRSVASSRVPVRVRRKVKGGLARTLNRREARLHRRALRRVRRADAATPSARRTRAPDGRVGHVHAGLTADLARRLDHDLVTGAFDAAGIPWFVVPALDDRRICIAVEQADKGQVRRVLRALLEEHTGYVTTVSPADNSTVAIPGSHVSAWRNYGRVKAFRVTWLRTDPTGNLWVGEEQGVDVEFWAVNTDLPFERLIGPRPNRVQRAVPRDAHGVEIGFDRLSGYADTDGSLEPTITLEDFDIPRLEEVTLPTDAVLLWQHATPWGEELLRAALRSLHQYAPWVDLIHVVAQVPPPEWLRSDERLTVFEQHPGVPPQPHRLPDVAETFLLMRPGALLGRPVRPFDYFTPHGGTRPRKGPWTAQESLTQWSRSALSATGRAVTHGYAPGPQPFSCKGLSLLVRAKTGLVDGPDEQGVPTLPGTHPGDGLAHHLGHCASLADPSGEATAALHAGLPHIERRLDRLLVRRDTQQLHFFGLGSDDALRRGGTDAVISFLHRYYPVPSPFEHGTDDQAVDEPT